MTTEQLSLRIPTSRGPAAVGPVLFILSILVLGIALGSTAYLGQAKIGLALIIAGGGFFMILAQPIIALVILISTMPLTYPNVLTGSGLLTINNLLGVTLLLIMLIQVYVRQAPWLLKEREIKIILLIFISAALLTTVAETLLPKVSLQMMIKMKSGEFRAPRDLTLTRFKDFFSRFAFMIFLVNFTSTKKHVKVLLLAFLACILVALPAAFSNLANGLTNDERVTAGIDIGGGSGWLSNENRFAFMCLLGMSMLFYFSAIARTRLIMIVTVPLMLGFAALIFLSGSRSGMLSLAISSGWLITRPGVLSLRAKLSLVGIGLVISLSLFPVLPIKLQERLLNLNPFNPQGEGSHSTEVRLTTIEEGLGIFARYPLTGVGVGNFRWVNAYYNDNFKPPHNSYLWALSETGLLCTSLYGLLFVALFKRLRTVRQLFRNDPDLPYIGDWVSFYFISFLFFSIFADIWVEELHLYMITGLAIVLHHLASREISNASSPSRVLH